MKPLPVKKQESANKLLYSSNWALFLDIDGTLLELADTPEQVIAGTRIRILIRNLKDAMHGALALISGRRISDIDKLFKIPNLSIAGLHGVEYRIGTDTRTYVQTADPSVMAGFRQKLRAYTSLHPELIMEDKGLSIAIHFRRAPMLQGEVENMVRDVILGHDTHFHIQSGKMIAEIKPKNSNKGLAIKNFMQTPPFQGLIPVFIGDDITDEDGFSSVNHLGGISIKVGPEESAANHYLERPSDVIDWLEKYLKFLSN